MAATGLTIKIFMWNRHIIYPTSHLNLYSWEWTSWFYSLGHFSSISLSYLSFCPLYIRIIIWFLFWSLGHRLNNLNCDLLKFENHTANHVFLTRKVNSGSVELKSFIKSCILLYWACTIHGDGARWNIFNNKVRYRSLVPWNELCFFF